MVVHLRIQYKTVVMTCKENKTIFPSNPSQVEDSTEDGNSSIVVLRADSTMLDDRALGAEDPRADVKVSASISPDDQLIVQTIGLTVREQPVSWVRGASCRRKGLLRAQLSWVSASM